MGKSNAPSFMEGFLTEPPAPGSQTKLPPPRGGDGISLAAMIEDGNIPVEHGDISFGGRTFRTISEEEAIALQGASSPQDMEANLAARLSPPRREIKSATRVATGFKRGDQVKYNGKRAVIVKTDVGVSGSGKFKHRIMMAGSSTKLDVKENHLEKIR